jgi:hypothetical protein
MTLADMHHIERVVAFIALNECMLGELWHEDEE